MGTKLEVVVSPKDQPATEAALLMSDKATPPEIWVESYLKMNRITYDYKTGSLRQNGEPLEYKTLIAMMRLYANNLGVENLSYYFKDAMAVWMRRESRGFLARLRGQLKFQTQSDDLCRQWVIAATGKGDEKDVAILRHWIWQIKRKLFNLEVEHHLFLCLFGKSGGGKSMAIHKLLNPIKDVTLLQNMTVFNDQFAKRMFARNYCMFLDEMGKSKQVDIDCMKNLITAPTVEWRGMQSEVINSAKQNCSFIAASNEPLNEKIKDPTSGRRFWQFDCQDQLDWSTINCIDCFKLWQSVDEKGKCPLLPVLEEIKNVQQRKLRVRDPIKDWMDSSCKMKPIDRSSPTTSKLYESFILWCKVQNITEPPTLQKFSRALSLETTAHHTYRGTTWPISFRE